MTEDIFRVKVSRCLEILSSSVLAMEEALQKSSIEINEYYRLRNLLREAQNAMKEVLKEAHLLFGPPPPYASPDFDQLRRRNLSQARLLVEEEEEAKIVTALWEDDLIRRFMTEEEVKELVHLLYAHQREGKRKLANFKPRLLIEKMKREMVKAEALLKEVKKKIVSS